MTKAACCVTRKAHAEASKFVSSIHQEFAIVFDDSICHQIIKQKMLTAAQTVFHIEVCFTTDQTGSVF